MLGADQVPPAQRFLMVEGLLSPSSLDKARPGLPASWPASARCLWLSFAYADLSLGSTFDTMFERYGTNHMTTRAVVHAVTQQFGKPFDLIPHGWKTISLIDFPDGVPAIIEQLPVAETWYEHAWSVGLCRRENLSAIPK